MLITFRLENCADLTIGLAGYYDGKECTPLIVLFPGEQKLYLNDSNEIKIYMIKGAKDVQVLDCIDVCEGDCIIYRVKLETDIEKESERCFRYPARACGERMGCNRPCYKGCKRC